MVLLLSKEANDSPHVLREVERAVSKNIPIIIYKLEEVTLSKSLEYFIMMHQWIDTERGFNVVLDAAESGKAYTYQGETYVGSDRADINIQPLVTGDSSWETSNIRTWLNSEEKNVKYADTEPRAAVMGDGKNAYYDESGFLNEFTESERKHIVTVKNITAWNVLNGKNEVETQDRVYLLSESELPLLEEGSRRYVKLTEAAKENDQAKWENFYMELADTDSRFYWLRDPVEDSATRVKVMTVENVDPDVVGLFSACSDGIGIRPVINVK